MRQSHGDCRYNISQLSQAQKNAMQQQITKALEYPAMKTQILFNTDNIHITLNNGMSVSVTSKSFKMQILSDSFIYYSCSLLHTKSNSTYQVNSLSFTHIFTVTSVCRKK